jgi:hypothetical protein
LYVATSSYAVYDISPVAICVDHFWNDIDIVLQIRIDAHGNVCIDTQESGNKCILVTAICGKLKPSHAMIFPIQIFYELPGEIGAAVVYVPDEAVRRNLAAGNHIFD